MPLPEIASLRPLLITGLRIVWPRLMALRLDQMVLVEGRDLLAFIAMEDSGPKVREVKQLGYKASRISLSPSRKFVLVRNDQGNWYEVLETVHGESLFSISGPESFPCTFALHNDADVLISAAVPGLIAMQSLPKGQRLARVSWKRTKPFMITEMLPVGGGDGIILVGHPFMERYATHLLLETKQLVNDDSTVLATIEKKIYERGAENVAIGPCGWDDVLVFEDHFSRNLSTATTTGLSVRKLETGDVLESVPCDAPITNGQPLMGTSLAVAVGMPDGVRIYPRPGFNVEPMVVPARGYSFDAETGRALMATPDCKLQIIQVART